MAINGYNGNTDDDSYFIYSGYEKKQISDANTIQKLRDQKSKSISAYSYYKEAYDFSTEVYSKFKDISYKNIVNNYDGTDVAKDSNGNTITDENGNNLQYWQTLSYNPSGNDNIFDVNNNDPLDESSSFNEHRKAVIRKSIEENLKIAFGNYNDFNYEKNYEYALPEISEIDWDKIVNNVSVLTFMQGIPLKYKYYNNYCVITNNLNKEFVNTEDIYIITADNKYHKPGCTKLYSDYDKASIESAYSSIDFLRQTAKATESSTAYYFYPKAYTVINNGNREAVTACYNCIVNAKATYDTNQLIKNKNLTFGETAGVSSIRVQNNNEKYIKVRELYLTALARCKYDLYKTNGYFGS